MARETLQAVRSIDIARESRPTVIMFTDPGRDSDDTFAFIQARRLQTLFELGLPLAVTTLTPALRRAELAQFIADYVGLRKTKIAAGSDLPILSKKDVHPYEFAGVPDGYGRDRISQNPVQEVHKTLDVANQRSVDVVVIAGFTDLDKAIQSPGGAEKFKEKARRIVIMGGVKTKDGKHDSDSNGLLVPDASSNYQFDREAAERVIQFAQQEGIPLRFVSRHAAYAARLPRDAYENAGNSGNPVGIWLRDAVSAGFQSLWERANSKVGTRGRALPDRCDRQWFIDTFCGNSVVNVTSKDSIWPFIEAIIPYDPLAIIAAVPELMDRFYEPYTVNVNGTDHEIIGLNEDTTGVKDADGLRQFLIESLARGLQVVTRKMEKDR